MDDEVPETLTYYSLLLVYLTTHELHASESNDVVPLRLVLVQVLKLDWLSFFDGFAQVY